MTSLSKILLGAINLFVPLVEPALLQKGADWLDQFLEEQFAKAPKRTVTLVSIVYSSIKGIAEDAAKKTDFKYDDDAIAAAEKELGDFAAKHGFELTKFPEE